MKGKAMKVFVVVCRVLMGLPLLIFGAGALFDLIPVPATLPQEKSGVTPEAHAALIELWKMGYLMPSACIAHMFSGTLLLLNRFVPLALAVHLPVSLQMSLFHLGLGMQGGHMALVILGLNVLLILVYRSHFKALLRWKVELK